jgi:hypothetical protein
LIGSRASPHEVNARRSCGGSAGLPTAAFVSGAMC